MAVLATIHCCGTCEIMLSTTGNIKASLRPPESPPELSLCPLELIKSHIVSDSILLPDSDLHAKSPVPRVLVKISPWKPMNIAVNQYSETVGLNKRLNQKVTRKKNGG